MLNLKAILWLWLLIGGGAFLFWSCLRTEDRRLVTLRPAGIGLGLITCTLAVPNPWILYGILVLSLPIVARSRSEAAALFFGAFLSMPEMSQHLLIGPVYLFTATARDALTISLLLALAVRRGPSTSLGAGRRQDAAFLLFFLIMAIIVVRGRIPTDMIRWFTERTLALAIPYFLLSRAIREPRDFRRVLLTLGMMGCALAAEAVFESRRGWPLMLLLTQHFGGDQLGWFRELGRLRGGVVRASASFTEPISFSFFLAFSLLAILTLRDAFRSFLHQYLAAILVAVGLYYTSARSGWLAAIVGMLLLDVYRRRYATLSAKVVVLAIATSLVFLAAQSSPWLSDRLGLTGHAQSTADYREQLARRGMEEFRKAPVIGRPDPIVRAAMHDLQQGEGIVDYVNFWLYFLLVTGVIGTVIIAVGMLIPVFRVLGARRRLLHRPSMLGIGGFLFASALMPMFALLVSSFEDRYGLVWVSVFAMAASFVPMTARLGVSAGRETAARDEVPAPELAEAAA